MPASPDGRLWSTRLNSFLVPDGPYLRLEDQYRQRRLTRAEAAEKQADALAERLRSLGIDPDQI